MFFSLDLSWAELYFTYVGENDIVCGDAVGGDEEESVFVHLENLADFATGDFLEADGIGIDARDDAGWCHVFLFCLSWWCLMLCRWSEVVRDVESGVCV